MRSMVAGALVMLALLGSACAVARRPASIEQPLRVLVLGDSMAISLQEGIDRALERTGMADSIPGGRLGYGFTASWPAAPPCLVCDPIPEYAPAMLTAAIAEHDPDAVVLLAGGWDGQARVVDGRKIEPFTAEWRDILTWLHRDAIDRLTANGAVVYWLAYPVCDVTGNHELSRTLNPMFHRAALDSVGRDGLGPYATRVLYLDTTRFLCPGGSVAAASLDGRTIQVFDETGHFSEDGAEYLGRWIVEWMTPAFGLQSVAV